MKLLFILTSFILVFSVCNKPMPNDFLAGDEYVRGRLFLLDTFTQQAVGQPLAKKKVTISLAASTDTVNYFLSTETDDNGYFVFQNLKKDTSYTVRYQETVGGVIYSARRTVTAPFDTLRITAEVAQGSQNGLQLTVLDPSGAVVKGAKVCVFNSASIAGYNTNGCDGNTYELTTDIAGHTSKYAIPQQKYYFNAKLEVNGIPLFAKDSVEVGSSIKFHTIQLKDPNGMQFTVMDSLGTRLPNASLCVFTSLALFQRDTCEGRSFQLTSSANGSAIQYNLPISRYYIYCTYQTGSFIWVARDTMDVGSQLSHDTLYLRKKY